MDTRKCSGSGAQSLGARLVQILLADFLTHDCLCVRSSFACFGDEIIRRDGKMEDLSPTARTCLLSELKATLSGPCSRPALLPPCTVGPQAALPSHPLLSKKYRLVTWSGRRCSSVTRMKMSPWPSRFPNAARMRDGLYSGIDTCAPAVAKLLRADHGMIHIETPWCGSLVEKLLSTRQTRKYDYLSHRSRG